MFLVFGSFTVSLTSAQQLWWDYCNVSAYGNDRLIYDFENFKSFEFTVVAPPSGSEITNTINVVHNETGENYTKNLAIGDRVIVRFDNYAPIRNDIVAGEESGCYEYLFEGKAVVSINGVDIPEFSPIIFVSMFNAGTILAIVYRKKRNPQKI